MNGNSTHMAHEHNTGYASTSEGIFLTDGYCERCGKPFIYIGDWWPGMEEQWCVCATKVVTPIVFDEVFRELLEKGSEIYAEIWSSLAEKQTPWECPRCHVINAPHVDRCDCKMEEE